jgi:hypothetical protein
MIQELVDVTPEQRWKEMGEAPTFDELREIDSDSTELIDHLYAEQEGGDFMAEMLGVQKRGNSRFRDDLVRLFDLWTRHREQFRARKVEEFCGAGKVKWI